MPPFTKRNMPPVGNFKFRTPMEMANGFGVSLPTFLRWMKTIIAHDEEGIIVFFQNLEDEQATPKSGTRNLYRCQSKKISPKEIRYICNALGDPECSFNHKKTTISSIAQEAGVSIRSAIQTITRYKVSNSDEIFGGVRHTRALPPKNAKIFRKILGLVEENDTFSGIKTH